METVERTDLTALSLDELEVELATLASHIYAGTCRWLELAGRWIAAATGWKTGLARVQGGLPGVVR